MTNIVGNLHKVAIYMDSKGENVGVQLRVAEEWCPYHTLRGIYDAKNMRYVVNPGIVTIQKESLYVQNARK
jgi:hypothetical protein